jgi:1-acyl-sn-glycerol-3-phosphate acyltransferase
MLLYATIRRIVRFLLAVFYRVRIYGRARIPATGALLLVSNHQSNLDPPVVGSSIANRHVDYLAKADLFRGVLGWLITSLNAVPIRGESGDAGAIREILRRLDEGRAVLIFPEGTRSQDGAMHEFKRGVALLVKRSKCPVQPVAVEGCFDAWRRGKGFPRLVGPRVAVAFGDPIEHDELMTGSAEEALVRLAAKVDHMRRALRAKLRRASRGRFPAPGPGDAPLIIEPRAVPAT